MPLNLPMISATEAKAPAFVRLRRCKSVFVTLARDKKAPAFARLPPASDFGATSRRGSPCFVSLNNETGKAPAVAEAMAGRKS